MVRMTAALLLTVGFWSQSSPGAKAMFYDPGDLGVLPEARPATGLKPINFARPFLHCGIHYWLETQTGTRVTERAASAMSGTFTIHLRNNIGSGFLTVWELSEGRELTPRDDRYSGGGSWSGYLMSDKVYVVPGAFEFAGDESKPKHVVIVWARSQTEVAHTAEGARARVERMSAWVRDGRPLIVREFEESAAGEIGTYVTNRADGGVVAEIVFRSK